MTEAEFWESTAAKVLKLHEVAVEGPARKRDFFSAQIISTLLNINRTSESPSITVDEILSQQYPPERNGYTEEPWDDSMGARGDWQSLRESLRNKNG